jgi:hypothetical protein
MTNEELLEWAGLDPTTDHEKKLDRLIWIAQLKAKESMWRDIAAGAVREADLYALTSYPSFIKRKVPK